MSKAYFWLLLTVFLSLGVLIQIQEAQGMQAAEIEPGIIEISTTDVKGFEIYDVAEKFTPSSKNTWVYFCMKERSNYRPKSKCFYGLKNEFKEIKKGLVLNGIQYGLSNRLYNSKGDIPLKLNTYFYPALIIRKQIT